MVGNIEPSGPGLWLANFSSGLQTDLELAEPKQVEAHARELQVLQGGTWSTGRKLAYERRPDGSPPLRVESDGTVF